MVILNILKCKKCHIDEKIEKNSEVEQKCHFSKIIEYGQILAISHASNFLSFSWTISCLNVGKRPKLHKMSFSGME